MSSYVVQHSPIPVLVVRSRKYRDIPDLTSDTVGAAYLGMTAVGKRRKIAIAVDGVATGSDVGSTRTTTQRFTTPAPAAFSSSSVTILTLSLTTADDDELTVSCGARAYLERI